MSQALICIALLVSSSIRYFRWRIYDAFLITHIILAAVTLAVVKLHLDVWKIRADFWNFFIWPCVAFWVFDRMLRLVRLSYYGRSLVTRRARASASLIPGTDIVRVDISDFFQDRLLPPAGSFYFAYETGGFQGYENHPFTVCSWSDRVAKTGRLDSVVTENTGPPLIDSENVGRTRYTMLIQARDGYTKRLLDRVSSSESACTQQLTMLLEGPYGSEAISLAHHSDILMIMGGVGITAAISRAYALLETGHTVRLIWTVRKRCFVDDVRAHELLHLRTLANICIYLTGEETRSADEKEIDDNDTTSHSSLELRLGRPDFEEVIARARADALRDLAVFCCAPEGLLKGCRAAVRELSARPGKDISMYEERFCW